MCDECDALRSQIESQRAAAWHSIEGLTAQNADLRRRNRNLETINENKLWIGYRSTADKRSLAGRRRSCLGWVLAPDKKSALALARGSWGAGIILEERSGEIGSF